MNQYLKNPFSHAVAAALYIVAVVFIIQGVFGATEGAETIFVPMLMLSLLVVSVAVMGFLFFAEPLRLFVDGKRKEAFAFFGKTVAAFAGFVALFMLAVLYLAA